MFPNFTTSTKQKAPRISCIPWFPNQLQCHALFSMSAIKLCFDRLCKCLRFVYMSCNNYRTCAPAAVTCFPLKTKRNAAFVPHIYERCGPLTYLSSCQSWISLPILCLRRVCLTSIWTFTTCSTVKMTKKCSLLRQLSKATLAIVFSVRDTDVGIGIHRKNFPPRRLVRPSQVMNMRLLCLALIPSKRKANRTLLPLFLLFLHLLLSKNVNYERLSLLWKQCQLIRLLLPQTVNPS